MLYLVLGFCVESRASKRDYLQLGSFLKLEQSVLLGLVPDLLPGLVLWILNNVLSKGLRLLPSLALGICSESTAIKRA